MSYDNGATFRVIKSMIGNCPLIQEWDFTVPSSAPTGDAILSWSWQNLIGNREFYQTCAWVNVQGAPSSRIKKRADTNSTAFDQLPSIWKANMAGLNTCNTVEGSIVHYANPGSDVYYGPGESATDPITEPNSNCDSPTPYGQTYQDLSTSGSGSNPALVPGLIGGVLSVVNSAVNGIFAEGSGTSTTSVASVAKPTATSTTTSSVTLTKVVTASVSVLSSVPTTLAKAVSSAPSAPAPSAPAPSAPAPSAQAPAPTGSIPFANKENLSQYLPCIAGSFLCLSSTQFLICDHAPGGDPSDPPTYWVGGPQQVAAGMQCSPYQAPLPTGVEAKALHVGQSPAVPAGFYRSDRYVSL
jgi:hypothetical protein